MHGTNESINEMEWLRSVLGGAGTGPDETYLSRPSAAEPHLLVPLASPTVASDVSRVHSRVAPLICPHFVSCVVSAPCWRATMHLSGGQQRECGERGGRLRVCFLVGFLSRESEWFDESVSEGGLRRQCETMGWVDSQRRWYGETVRDDGVGGHDRLRATRRQTGMRGTSKR